MLVRWLILLGGRKKLVLGMCSGLVMCFLMKWLRGWFEIILMRWFSMLVVKL